MIISLVSEERRGFTVMNHRFAAIIVLFLCTLTALRAQELNPQGASAEELLPQGWSHYEAEGDLNKDGLADLVLIATPDFKDKMFTRDDGYVYNFNQPILAVYFRTPDGRLSLWRQYPEMLPADESEYCHHNVSLTITDKGTLVIETQLECSMGGYTTGIDRYVYRYQNDDFYLIGKENEEIQRNSGDCTLVSDNYLVWKRCVKTSNFTEDTPPKEKWSVLKQKPLEKMGSCRLGEE